MAKNGNKKNELIRTVNLGKPGEPARELIEMYERKVGKMKISKLIREMIVRELSSDSSFDGYKIRQLTEERKNIHTEIKKCQEELKINQNKLVNLGLTIDEVCNL